MFIVGTVVAQSNEAYTDQSGAGTNTSYVDQANTVSEADPNSADVDQVGDNNESDIWQYGAGNNSATTSQMGNLHDADVQQLGAGNTSNVNQFAGNSSEAWTHQNGSGNIATHTQEGNNKMSHTEQYFRVPWSHPASNSANAQVGANVSDYNQANLTQDGDGNSSIIYQAGDYNNSNVYQSGDDHCSLLILLEITMLLM